MREGNIPADWFARQVAQADRTDGDIDTLSNRIAHVRTWTFVANRPDWLADPEHWQGVTRAVEDKLSDALHERLAERFVDRRTSVLMRRLRENTMLETEIGKTGEVTVEGHVIGRLDGFMFAPDASGRRLRGQGAQRRRAKGAGRRDRGARHQAVAGARTTRSCWRTTARCAGPATLVGKLIAGDDVLRPRVRIVADEHLTGPARELVQTRLDLWLKTHIEKLLAPLFSLTAADDVTGMARGVAFQAGRSARRAGAAESGGGGQGPRPAVARDACANTACASAPITSTCRCCSSRRRARWRRSSGRSSMRARTPRASPNCCISPRRGRTSIPVDKETPKPLYRTAGYRVCGERAVRVDILERLADLIRPALSWREGAPGPKPDGAFDGRGFTVTGAMTSLTGASGEDFASILRSLGYRMDRKPKPAEPAPASRARLPADGAAGRCRRRSKSPPTEVGGERARRRQRRRLPMFCHAAAGTSIESRRQMLLLTSPDVTPSRMLEHEATAKLRQPLADCRSRR